MNTDSDTGRVAVITGASSGIGEATARALAAEGHRVALLARRADRIQALADELGDGAIAVEADVTDRDSLVAAAQRVQDELGGADVLVNNAGVMLLAPFTSEQRAEQRQMVEVNLLGAMTATEVFLDQLRDGGGDLVNISSVAGRTARAGNAAYAATKWGLNGWSEALRQELQPDVRVIVVEPGAVATELTDHITHSETRQGTEQFYAATAISADDIARIVAFAVTRPRSVSLNEILVRPTAQALRRGRDAERDAPTILSPPRARGGRRRGDRRAVERLRSWVAQ
jgi:NADP-dependent 3-hydroxy acid dehydrogenase YdfG